MQTNPETATKNTRHTIHGLYAIADTEILAGKNLLKAVEQAIQGGASLVQLRDKSEDINNRKTIALALKKLCADHGVCFIINDDVQLAAAINADGVHLGKEDLSITEARKIVGNQAIIGASCYNQLALAEAAQIQGADYIAFGSFFNSPTKPDAVSASLPLVEKARDVIKIPMVAIGGITPDNAGPLIAAGMCAIAVASGIFSQDNIKAVAASYCQLFK